MFVVQCANGYVGWIFQYTTSDKKRAVCLNDGFFLEYDESPTLAWATMVTAMIQHSVALRGAFSNTHWLQP